MSLRTVEVELEKGRVWPRSSELLPLRATALLTILELHDGNEPASKSPSSAGLKRFLSTPDFALTTEQFKASMDADFYDQ